MPSLAQLKLSVNKALIREPVGAENLHPLLFYLLLELSVGSFYVILSLRKVHVMSYFLLNTDEHAGSLLV